jgi:hypothetical protein
MGRRGRRGIDMILGVMAEVVEVVGLGRRGGVCWSYMLILPLALEVGMGKGRDRDNTARPQERE